MMFGGGMLLMWLLPLLAIGLIVVIAVVVAGGGLGILRQIGGTVNGPTGQGSGFSTKVCPTCQRPLQADWRVCPYDGTEVR
jgi:hypothetical protein